MAQRGPNEKKSTKPKPDFLHPIKVPATHFGHFQNPRALSPFVRRHSQDGRQKNSQNLIYLGNFNQA